MLGYHLEFKYFLGGKQTVLKIQGIGPGICRTLAIHISLFPIYLYFLLLTPTDIHVVPPWDTKAKKQLSSLSRKTTIICNPRRPQDYLGPGVSRREVGAAIAMVLVGGIVASGRLAWRRRRLIGSGFGAVVSPMAGRHHQCSAALDDALPGGWC